ncbi:hypothetical protein P153DRAFT_374458 [Dothidotthia symphoricarpi CBS 119687]|uniref:Pre-mRNA splicing factor CLF1 n=1 Tax=Dothidotthia symphoricarpi CBS 119687 TaxID=1392245 RepID=A0A6A6AL49_9PLEO|nr:uncharacterized protein P153DRAFT_374458 [Dothidotthia symphoricarpi CBS 119687]KAF2131654.1 hypothetical protein P153DRAFT_374458 [Dothidotthia symphoricarpi CBS 119687]
MGTPEPKYSLSGHCSVIHDETLYVYSPTGFQSLKLEEGAEWKALPMDISLTGAQCVKAAGSKDDDARLYIVGGVVNATASTWNYPGLMHYSFSQKKWDWVRAESWNTQNRQNHGAVYIQDSKKILVYAGSQTTGDVAPSTQSFLFSTVSPYLVESLPSNGAPPAVDPLLLSSDSSSAVMVGGGATNTAVWKFSEDEGWTNMGVTLEQPIVSQEHVQCTVVTGSNGMKVLEKFDMSVSPNEIERIVLLGKDGKAAATGTTIGDKAKRFTVSNWPDYNSTLAPMSQRSGYSLAQGDDGMTVASGGNETEPLVIFNAKANSWVNATAMFDGQQILTDSVTSSISSSTPTSTASATASSGAAAAAAPDNKSRMLTVLGATLGTIFGIAAILVLLLLFLKFRKNKRKQSQQPGSAEKDKDRLSFADRGAEFMKEAGGSVISHNYTLNNDSHSSLAIMQGRGAGNHKKNMASDASTAGLVKQSSPLAYTQPVELSKFDLKPEPIVRQNSSRTPHGAPVSARARSSGWSKYFANNEATNLANMPADRSTYASDRTSTISQSEYTNSRIYSQHRSQLPPPLEIPKFPSDSQRLSSVASGSPTLGNGPLPHQIQPMSAELGRANSNGSVRSGLSHNDEHYSRRPVESWTPVGHERPPSSTYTASMHIDPNQYNNGMNSFYPKSNVSSFYPDQSKGSLEIPDARDSTFTMFPSGKASGASPLGQAPVSTFSSMYPAPPRIGEPQDRGSTVTVFPGPDAPSTAYGGLPSPQFGGSFYPPPRIGHDSTVTMFPGPDPSKDQGDMSWLNLGAQK